MNLSILQLMYPPKTTNHALTGYIPMKFFTENEHMIRYTIKKHDLRMYYRGKRIGTATTTRREDATAIVLYPNTHILHKHELNHSMPYTMTIGFATLVTILSAIALGYITFNNDVVNKYVVISNADTLLTHCVAYFTGENNVR